MWRCNADLPAPKPPDFDAWAEELLAFADCQGECATIGIVMHFAPIECVRALAADPPLWAVLLARARYADMKRFQQGVQAGRRLGL